MTIVIEKGRAEVLTLYPSRQYPYVPTAADIRIGTPSTKLPVEGSETSITANIDGVNTTTSAAADRGADSIVVTSATGITAGRRYLLKSRGTAHWPTVRAVDGTTVYLTEPLRDDVISGATLQGVAVTHTLTTGETSTVGGGTAIWRLTLNGIARRFDDAMRVEARVFPLTLTADSLLRRKEVWSLRDATDLELDEAISEAWESILRVKLRAKKIVEDRIRTPSEIEPAHKEAVIYLLKRAAGRSTEEIEKQEQILDRAIRDVLESKDLWYDEPTSEAQQHDGNSFAADYANIAWISR